MIFRQGHAVAVVDKKIYIFGGSSGSGVGGQHDDATSDPVYLNDLFLLKGMHNVHIIVHNHIISYIEDITWMCGDTKFLFECGKYFTSERSERVKYFST